MRHSAMRVRDRVALTAAFAILMTGLVVSPASATSMHNSTTLSVAATAPRPTVPVDVEAYLGGPAVAEVRSWLSTLVLDGEAIGTVRLWKPNGDHVELAGLDQNVALGNALLNLDPAVVLIDDARDGAFLTLQGHKITVLQSELPSPFETPVRIADAQAIVTQAYGESGGTTWSPTQSDDWWPAIGMTLAIMGLASITVVLIRRR